MGIISYFRNNIEDKKTIENAKSLINIREYDRAINIVNSVIERSPNNYNAIITRARAFCYLEEYDRAIEDFNKAIEINPIITDAYFFRGQIYIIKDNLYGAIDDFSRVIEVDRRNHVAYMKRGSVYSKLGFYDKALENFMALVRIRWSDEYAYELLLASALSCKNYKIIKKYSKKLIKLNEDSSRGYYYLARVYYAEENREKAREMFTEAIRRDSDNFEYYYHRGICYMINGEYNEAIVDFTKGIGLSTGEVVGFYYSRGYSYVKIREYERAISDYEKAIEIKSNDPIFYFELSRIYFDINDFDKVLYTLDRAEENVKSWPYKAFSYVLRGDIYYNEKNNVNLAIENYTKSIEIDPTVYAYTCRGRTYLTIKEYKLAIGDFNRAISIDPNNHGAFYRKAICYESMGDTDNAIKFYNMAIDKCSNDEKIKYYNSRGRCYLEIKEYDKAINDFTSLINSHQEAEYYLYRGLAKAGKMKYKSAIEDYNKAIEINPMHSEAYLSRGHALRSIKKYTEAIQDYKRSGEVDNNYRSNAYYNIGLIYSIVQDSKKALYYFNKAIRINPSNNNAIKERDNEILKLEKTQNSI